MTIHRTSNYIKVEGCVLGLDIGEDFELFKIDPSIGRSNGKRKGFYNIF